MAHFAEISHADPTSENPATVIRVICVDDADCRDDDNLESEAVGIAFLQSMLDGEWVQTSYNGKIRGRFTGIGDWYDGARFYDPQPYPSWTLDDDYQWQPPVDPPDDYALGRQYVWKENTRSWVEEPDFPSWTWTPDHEITHPDGTVTVFPCYVPPSLPPTDGNEYVWNEETTAWETAE